MNTLVRCYDRAYEEIAKISRPSAQAFAGYNDLRLIELVYDDTMSKVKHVLDSFTHDVHIDLILYADVDILFTPKATLPLDMTGVDGVKPDHSESCPVWFSIDSAGICAGLFSMRRCHRTMDILEIWNRIGPLAMGGHGNRITDQGTISMLRKNVPWIFDSIGLISQNIVSNPECSPGWMAHHFWANGGEKWWGKMRSWVEIDKVLYHDSI